MKAHLFSTLLLTAGCCLAHASGERYVTTTAQGLPDPPYAVTNHVSIVDGETAEVVSVYPPGGSAASFTKDGVWFPSVVGDRNLFVVVKGPATFHLVAQGGGGSPTATLLTLKIKPESYPPDKTLILPPGTNQVFVTLESSTNLVQWASATNGVYGSPNEARFFRINMQKLN